MVMGTTSRFPFINRPCCTVRSFLSGQYTLSGPGSWDFSGQPSKQYMMSCLVISSCCCWDLKSSSRSSVVGRCLTIESTYARTSVSNFSSNQGSPGWGVCCIRGIPRYIRNRVGESHHAHSEPLYTGWQVLKVPCTQQGYSRLVVGLNVEFQAN